MNLYELKFSGDELLWSMLIYCHGYILTREMTRPTKAPYTRKRFPAFLYCLLFSRESRTTSSLLETIQKSSKTFPCVRGPNHELSLFIYILIHIFRYLLPTVCRMRSETFLTSSPSSCFSKTNCTTILPGLT